MIKRYLSVSHQELTRQKVKFALRLKVKPSIIAQKAKITERTVKGIKRVKGSGRKTILSQSDKLRIKHRLKQNPFISLYDLVVELDLICTARTVKNYLCSLGFKWRKPELKPPLADQDKKERFQWCERNKNSLSWNKVIFSDGAIFWISDNNKMGWFKEGYSDTLINDHYAGKVNVWAAISERGKVGIHVFENNLKSDIYINILKQHLIPQANELYPKGWLFQQNNYPVHTSFDSERFIKANIQKIEWPGYSADLSPIENLWPLLKKKVRQRLPHSLIELKNIIYQVWYNFDNQYISNLCTSIHNRIDLCITNMGDKIKY